MGYSSGLKNKLNAKAESNNNICLSRGTMPFSTALFHMSWWLDFQHPLWQRATCASARAHAWLDKHTTLPHRNCVHTFLQCCADAVGSDTVIQTQWDVISQDIMCVWVCACVHMLKSVGTDAVLWFLMCNPQIHHVTHETDADERVNVAEYRLNS